MSLRHRILISVLFVCSAFFAEAAAVSDTIRPVITTSAVDEIVECNNTTTTNISALTDWYNAHGGALATDNSGVAVLTPNLTLDQVLDTLESNRGNACGEESFVEVEWVAIDDCNNVSINTTKATFFIRDTKKPIFIVPPSIITVACDENTQSLLNNWINAKGGAVVDDSCSPADEVEFVLYIAVDNFGNNQTGNFDDPVEFVLDPALCYEFVNVSFWVQDPCGNTEIASGQFQISDSEDPVWDTVIEDLTVDCDQLDIAPVLASDQCIGTITPVMSDVSTQDADSSLCGHFNYTITRTWTAEDACGNQISDEQIITVQDTTAPNFNLVSEVFLDCTQLPSSDVVYGPSNVTDNCSDVSINFSDQMLGQGCTFDIQRTWTAEDVCGNVFSMLQIIHVSDASKPIVTSEARDTSLSCTNLADLNNQLQSWISSNGYSTALDDCSSLLSFSATPGSYDLEDPSTYPGTLNTDFSSFACESGSNVISTLMLDFVYYDECGNATVTAAEFQLIDTIAPTIVSCPQDTVLGDTDSNCEAIFTLEFSEVADNCSFSEPFINLTTSAIISSATPGDQTVPVDSVQLVFGPIDLNNNTANGNVSLQIDLFNLDSGEPTEFFIVKGEDGTILDSTGIFTECDNASFSIENLSADHLNAWGSDGFITIWLVPNLPSVNVLAINDICNGSSASAEIAFEIDIQNSIRTAYSIDAQDTVFVEAANFPIVEVLSTGNHSIEYFYFDCGANVSSCVQQIIVEDKIDPVISCPSDTMITLPLDTCAMEYALSFDFNASDNCSLPFLYNKDLPESLDESLITFSYNSDLDTFLADNLFFNFFDVPKIEHSDGVAMLSIDLTGDINEENEVFEIYGEGGVLLGITQIASDQSCTSSISNFVISKEQLNQWAEDGELFITAVAPNDSGVSGGGVNNCQFIDPTNNTDGVSNMSAQLQIMDARVEYEVSGATQIGSTLLYPNGADTVVILNGGINTVEYIVSDAFGNTGSCTYEVFVKDEEDPQISCTDYVVFIHPSGLEDYELISSEIVMDSSDNCQLSSIGLSEHIFTCDQVGEEIEVVVLATDEQGNTSSCVSTIKVEATILSPDFTAGICPGDTLKLFANVPSANVTNAYTFTWSGPDGFVSNLENPIIVNPDDANNGTYVLNVEGFGGCASMGTVEVQIQQLTTPDLSSNSNIECVGEDLILSSTSYSGQVEYKWFEGIPPSGVLLNTTSQPNLVLNPTIGSHTYYVEVESQDCSTLPSAPIEVDVLAVPNAGVQDAFITLCEGENLILGADQFDPSFTYNWTGPNGYVGNGQFPEVVQDVTALNQGLYQLVIDNGACNSDAATSNVVIFNAPETPVITGEEILCEGSSFVLSVNNVTNADQYSWFLNGNLFITESDNNFTLTSASEDLAGEWTVLIQEGLCLSDTSAVFNVFVEDEFQIGVSNSGNNGFVCEGDSVTLNASFIPNADYIWETPIGEMIPGQTISLEAKAGTYTVTVRTQAGCKSEAATTVFVDEIPTITALSNNSEACMDGTQGIQFFPSIIPSGLYDYDWSGPQMFSSDVPNPIIPNASSALNGIYTLVVTNGECVSEPELTVVQITDIPSKPIIESDLSYCIGDDIVLSTTLVTDATYMWNTPSGDFTTSEPQLVISGANNSNAGMYSLIVSVNGCESEVSTEININIEAVPNAPNALSNSPICEGDTLFFNAGQIQNAIYEWEGPSGFMSALKDPFVPNVGLVNSGTYRVRILSNGCPSDWTEVDVAVLPIPATPVFTETDLFFCESGVDTELCWSTQSQGNISYTLVLNGNDLNTSMDTCYSIALGDLNLNEDNVFQVFATQSSCASSISDSLVVDISEVPNFIANADLDLYILCDENEVNISSEHGAPDVALEWVSLNPEVDIVNPFDQNTTLNNIPYGTHQIVLNYSSEACIDYSSDTISVVNYFPPMALNDTLSLAIDLEEAIYLLQNDQYAIDVDITVTQEPLGGEYSIENGFVNYIPDPLFPGEQILAYEICYVECPDLCSEALLILQVETTDRCIVPTLITPNADGFNDALIIPCLSTQQYPNNEIKIFNEWGDQVFEAKPYLNNWQGTYNGSNLPVGTYYYVLDQGDGSEILSGFIHLEK